MAAKATPFPFSVEFKVRGYEIDAYHHVNNAVYLSWLEHARWELGECSSLAPVYQQIIMVMRHVDLNYKREVLMGDTVRVALWPRRVGTSSFTLGSSIRIVGAHEARRVGILAMVASTTLVSCQRGGGKIPVPTAWRELFPENDPGEEPPAGC